MSGFSQEWLALREPADAAARSIRINELIAENFRSRSPIRIVDLGCGAGSNLRYLTPRLESRQEWLLVDNDPVLLELARVSVAGVDPARVDVSSRLLNLSELTAAIFEARDLVTASALLDLVSDAWLTSFVSYCRGVGACVLAVLNYDGRIACTPEDEDDERVRMLVNRHQRTDKGLGPALGPDAGARAEALLREAGFVAVRERSDWLLGSEHQELQRQLIDGWAGAASEMAPAEASRIEAWRLRRQAHVDESTSVLRVGHDDVAGFPPR